MRIPFNPCEACRIAPIECNVDSDDPEQPYLLCQQCSQRLLTFSLRPLEWFRLAAIHGPGQYYLHDDFYFYNGVAQAPREKVLSPELFPAPTLDQAREHERTLIDYAMTQHHLALEEHVFSALRGYDRQTILALLQQRVAHTHSLEIESQAYIICAHIIGREAEDWIRSRWDIYRTGIFFALAEASASCLPLEESFDRVVQHLEMMTQREIRAFCSVLAYFHTTRTLDWLEGHVSSPITDMWGRLAAQSHFSWARATKWLDSGRPLSLVALDALHACGHNDTPLLRKFAPKLLEPDTKELVTATLEQYAALDPAPRVKQRVAAITRQWDSIIP